MVGCAVCDWYWFALLLRFLHAGWSKDLWRRFDLDDGVVLSVWCVHVGSFVVVMAATEAVRESSEVRSI